MEFREVTVYVSLSEMLQAKSAWFPTGYPVSELLAHANQQGLEEYKLMGEYSEIGCDGVKITLRFEKDENPGLLG